MANDPTTGAFSAIFTKFLTPEQPTLMTVSLASFRLSLVPKNFDIFHTAKFQQQLPSTMKSELNGNCFTSSKKRENHSVQTSQLSGTAVRYYLNRARILHTGIVFRCFHITTLTNNKSAINFVPLNMFLQDAKKYRYFIAITRLCA